MSVDGGMRLAMSSERKVAADLSLRLPQVAPPVQEDPALLNSPTMREPKKECPTAFVQTQPGIRRCGITQFVVCGCEPSPLVASGWLKSTNTV